MAAADVQASVVIDHDEEFERAVEKRIAEDLEELAEKEAAEARASDLLRHRRIEEAAQRLASEQALPSLDKIGRSAQQLLDEVPEDVDWLVPGLLGKGWSLKIAAREKVGKGVFTAYLLGCLERGEATAFGPSKRTTALVFTEEPQDAMREKVADAGLKEATVVYGHELQVAWPAKVDALVEIATRHGHGLIFVDNISRAAAVEDEAGPEMGRAVELLDERAKAAGLSVVLNHHHKKGGASVTDKSRGTTAVAAACDNNVEMFRRSLTSRVRDFVSIGRVKATTWQRSFELTDDHSGYIEVPWKGAPDDVAEGPRISQDVQKLVTAREVLRRMGSATAKAFAVEISKHKMGSHERTGKRWLERLELEGSATGEGDGAKRVWTWKGVATPDRQVEY